MIVWTREEVLDLLMTGYEGTATEISQRAGIRKQDVLSALAAWEKKGQVVSELRGRVDGKRGRGRRVYRFAREGDNPHDPASGNERIKEGWEQ